MLFVRERGEIWQSQSSHRRHNTAHAFCILDNEGYTHTLIMFNTYSFSTVTVITRTRPSVTFYVHCVSHAIWILSVSTVTIIHCGSYNVTTSWRCVHTGGDTFVLCCLKMCLVMGHVMTISHRQMFGNLMRCYHTSF